MVRHAPGLKTDGFPMPCQPLYPRARFTIRSSPRHLPCCRLLQLEGPLATPASSNPPSDPAPFALPVKPRDRSPVVGTAWLRCAVPRAALPPLAHPAFPLFSYLRIHVSLQLLASRSWNDDHAVKQSLPFLNYDTWICFGSFRDLLYLWVESCDLLPVASQRYELLCGSWLNQLGVVRAHAAFSARRVGTRSCWCNCIRARGLS